jgi:DHA1 family tetracycline resistance protein-like MFS transporter
MSSIITLFLIVFVNILGFGIVIPLLPFYALRVGAGPELVTIIIGLYSLMQFLTSPFLGRLSDKYGRRPILMWTLAFSIISYIMLGIADSLEMLIASRIIGGAVAGNLATAFAYVTDVTTPANRAKSMGMLGASFSMGFVFGPAIGGFLAGNELETANFLLPALVATGLTLVAFIGVIFVLPESLSAEIRAKFAATPRQTVGEQLRTAFSRRVLVALSGLGFLGMVCWSVMEGTFTMWANDTLKMGPRDIGIIFGYTGILAALVQGGGIGPLVKRFGERALVGVTVIFYGIGFAWLATVDSVGMMYAAMTMLALGNGIFNPTMSSLVSKEAAETERGAVLGTYQGAGALGRITGPAVAGVIYANLGPSAPFYLSALVAVPAAAMLLMSRHK